MVRVIFHIDLNAYFASAEILRNSALEGQPIVVGGLNKRSVVCTASYEARAYGVHAAMPLYEAQKLCPNLVVVEGDMNYYKKISNDFFEYIRTFSPLLEIASIDECYVDVTEVIKNYDRPLDLAWDIQQGLLEKLHLKCSIGIGPTKFLAKMASDMKKPLGIVVIRRSDIEKKLYPLPIEDMFGIGKKTTPHLREVGIETIGDLVKSENEVKVKQILGKQALSLIECAKGYSSDCIEYSRSVKSLSQSTTLNDDIVEYADVCNVFKQLSKGLSKRCKDKQVKGKLISISIRYYDFRNVVRSTNISNYTDDEGVFYENALYLFDENKEDDPIRHLGISVGSLFSKDTNYEQLNIFVKPQKVKKDIIRDLNKEIPEGNFMFAADLIKKENNHGSK